MAVLLWFAEHGLGNGVYVWEEAAHGIARCVNVVCNKFALKSIIERWRVYEHRILLGQAF
jgi:hypothetical protein